MRVVLLLCTLFLFGCGGAAVRNAENYKGYIKVLGEQRAENEKQLATVLTMAQSPSCDARCVEHVAAVAAMAMMSGSRSDQIAPPPREASGAETFARVMTAMSPLAATMVTGLVQMRQSDNSRDVSLAQYGFLGGVVRDVSTLAGDIQPSITVGGDYVGDGNTVVRGTYIGRDNIGRDRTDNSGVIHTGDNDRYSSPGPYDDHGGNCRDGTPDCSATDGG